MLRAGDFLFDQSIRGARSETPAPRVSVILPTFRRCASGELERAMRSVLEQTFRDLELIVMDDGSSDGSEALIESLRARDPRVIHVRHEHNCGLPALRVNEGIELARGRWIAFQFDDDRWRPDALATLVAAAERCDDPAVIVARAHVTMRIGHVEIPDGPVDTLSLHERNRVANNSVLVPKELFSAFGMYDPHIGMRRLCDWDLWLRLVRHVPFVVLDATISDVFEGSAGAIGLTVPYDIALFRLLHGIPRNHLLTPDAWRRYEIDALRIGDFEVPGAIRRRLYDEQILPYYLRFRHVVPHVEGFATTAPPAQPELLAYTKESYEIGNDILMTNFDARLTERGTYKSVYQPLGEMGPAEVAQADAVLLVRTVENHARSVLDGAIEAGKPVGYCMDDDLLTFHEFGPQFAYLAPGTRYYRNLTYQLSRADAVVVTSPFIAESARPLNPRVVLDNGAIPEEYLPAAIPVRAPGRPLKIGYVGTGYRIEEFEILWDALRRIAAERGDAVVFEFWGLDVGSLPPLAAPVVQRPFTFNYYAYLRALGAAGFDLLLTPLLDHPRPRLGKARIKYYETAVAGALGIFSDVPQYRTLPDGLTCLKARNAPDDWHRALAAALDLAADERDAMRRRCVEHVREEFTVAAQTDLHESALRAVSFHGRTRACRHEDGRPRIVYALHSPHRGGAELQLLRRMALARAAGIEPIALLPRAFAGSAEAEALAGALGGERIAIEHADYSCFTEPREPAAARAEAERAELREVLERCRPALVHSTTYIPSLGRVALELAIPHVASLFQVEWAVPEEASFAPEHCVVIHSDSLHYASVWSALLGGVSRVCARPIASENVFELGSRRLLRRALSGAGGSAGATAPVPRIVLAGTFQERKQQRETIHAAVRLAREGLAFELVLCGYTRFFPEYVASCRAAIAAAGLEERIRIEDFQDDMAAVLERADVLLTLSTHESLPGTIADAMAAGVLVVATPVGGIPEIVIDGVSGILCAGAAIDDLADGIRRALALPFEARQRIVRQARRVARFEFHPQRAANDLLAMYDRALGGRATAHLAGERPREASAPRAWTRREAALTERPLGAPASAERVGARLVYDFEPRNENWNGLDLLLGTHGQAASGRLALRVVAPSGRALRDVSVALDGVRDNDWLPVRFEPIRNSLGKRFRLELGLRDASAETRVSVYQTAPPPERPRALARGVARRLGLPLGGRGLYCRESALLPGADSAA